MCGNQNTNWKVTKLLSTVQPGTTKAYELEDEVGELKAAGRFPLANHRMRSCLAAGLLCPP